METSTQKKGQKTLIKNYIKHRVFHFESYYQLSHTISKSIFKNTYIFYFKYFFYNRRSQGNTLYVTTILKTFLKTVFYFTARLILFILS